MSALALNGGNAGGPGRGGPAITLGRVLAVGAVALVGFVLWSLISAQIVTKRPNEMKTTQVVLPPPPPPPPPEPKPQEKPPEPTDAPPVEQPQDTPPPPTPQPQQASQPSPGDNALTAREGAGPSNYGLAAGDGSGGRIGGRPGGAGGDGFVAYASVARVCVQTALQADRELSRARYTAQLSVRMAEDGRIAAVVLPGGGDAKREARVRDVLVGTQCAQKPPAGLPLMRLSIATRPAT